MILWIYDVSMQLSHKVFSEIFSKEMKGDNEDWCFSEQSEDAFLIENKVLFSNVEQSRRKLYKTYSSRRKIAPYLIFLPIIALILYLFYFSKTELDSFVAICFGPLLSATLIGVVYSFVITPKLEYTLLYKNSFLPKLIKFFGNFTYTYLPEDRIDPAIFRETMILPKHRDCLVEDLFEGKYREISIKFFNLKLLGEIDADRDKSVAFKGLGIFIDTGAKRFLGNTVLCPYRRNLHGEVKEHWRLKRVKLVDPKFEKIFNAFGSDQVEARFLLDPVMMEKLKDLYSKCDTGGLSASFYDNKVFIMMSSAHDHFEPAPLHISAMNEQPVLRIKKEIEDVLSIIDILSLYDPQKVHEQNSSKPDQETGTA
ncbi:MAG: DUF3137 domain-containing protein [Alcanivorax sp.]